MQDDPAGGRLRRNLNSFEVLLLTLSCLSPVVSIFGIGGDVLHQVGTGAAALFALGIGAAVVWAAMYAELGSAYPYAGADYVGVGTILGGWAGVVTLGLWAATVGPSLAFTAKSLAPYVIELAPGLPAGPIPFVTLAAAAAIALLGVRTGALVTGAFLAIELAAVAVLIGVGLIHPARGVETLAAQPFAMIGGRWAAVPAGAMALGAITAIYATVGGNQALAFGEELKEPHRRMGRVVVAACMIGAFATALPVVLVILSARDLPAVLASPAPFATFLSAALGPWAGPALSAGVALAIFNALAASVMIYGRLYFSLGRDRLFGARLNGWLARVSPGGVPRSATLTVTAFGLACCFIDGHVLLVFMSGLLVYGWGLVCLAVLIGRRKGLTGAPGYWRAPLFPLFPVLGLIMTAVFTVSDLMDADAGRPSVLLLGLVVLAALAWYYLVLKRRPGGWTPSLEQP
ncbi:APC family permease [Phenylobacterium sp.]|uniref:APC family permease n=1 Tax=Phenylobacterium sp. TaxID=1871053 RepID=UPI002C761D9A|nr:APC family permease [Phenylobacterium sp.]HLZ76832.1 APC family permease [Phenylobacterium sp.]